MKSSKKYQGLIEKLRRMGGVKALVEPLVIGALGGVTPKLGEWFKQVLATASEIAVKSAILGTAKILRRTLKPRGLW